MNLGWIRAVCLGQQQLTEYSPYRGSLKGIQGIRISLHRMPQYATTPENPVALVTDSKGEVQFNNLGWGLYVVRCLDDPNTDFLVEIDKWTFTPSTKLVKFEINT